MVIKLVKNRDGDMVPFDPVRIKNAIQKAYEFTETSLWDIDLVVSSIVDVLETMHNQQEVVGLEHIQDVVEQELMKAGKYEVAKQYIIYRQKHDEERKKNREEIQEKFEDHKLKVIKDDGSWEFFDINKVRSIYDKVVFGLEKKCLFVDLEKNLTRYLVDKIASKDIMKMLVKCAIDLISIENIDWQLIAGRLLTSDLYKQASRERKIAVKDLYTPEAFADLVEEYVKDNLYYQEFFDHYTREDFLKAGEYIDAERDMDYGCTTLLMFNKRYLLNPNGVIKELPQYMYMAAAMFLAVPEKEDRLKKAFEFYDITSQQKLSLPTPTLMNARRKFHQLSSCFKISVGDDLRSIYHSIENIAQISKFGGWVWTYRWNIRSKGGSIRWVKWVSGGILPWLKVVNDTAIAVNQLGARAGAVSVTNDVWHRDIHDYLHMQTETGDIRRKCFDIFPSVSVPDLFMKRVEEWGDWTLFDPKEILDVTGKRLQDFFGDEFSKFYEECENDDRLELKEKTWARDLFKVLLKSVVETGLPYVFFRDTVNTLNPNKHAGNIYSTQLCTEILQNMSETEFVEEVMEDGTVNIKYKPWDSVVCNIASLNMAKVHTEAEMQKVIPLSIRILDNVTTMSFFPFKEAELTAKKYRSIGLWFLGMAEYLATNGFMYESSEAREHIDELFEKYAYYTVQASVDLAKEKWKYEVFDGSEWSKWIVMWKDKNWFASNSKTDLNWNALLENLQRNGMRNAYLFAPAPNTSTANVVGTTAGILPIYKKYYVYTDAVAPSVNVAPKLSKENFWLYKEYANTKMPEVIEMVATVQKWIDQSISFEWIINPADTSPKDVYDYYFQAWKAGIKTVYYVRSMSLDVKECVSCSG